VEATVIRLLTNDDGIDAPGLAAMVELSQLLDGPSLVVAPDSAHSGCGHRTTTDRPLAAARRGERRFAVNGSPADCVRLGLLHLAPDAEWVLSGINDGGNLGVDLYMSGTVAAAREAALLGRRAAAISQYRGSGATINWQRAIQLARRALTELPMQTGSGFWNINLPDAVPGIDAPNVVLCPVDPHPLPVQFDVRDNAYHYSGSYHQRPRLPNSDVAVCFSGHVAVSFVRLQIG
jgi:5'-nucleotidase